MDSNSWRVGVVPYTNAFPLTWFLPQCLPEARLGAVPPSLLGKQLQNGEVDVALLSSIELLRHPEYNFIPHIGICSDGAVQSVCVFSKKTPNNWKTIALDPESLTSNTLLQILNEEYWKISPQLIQSDAPLETRLLQCDAALSIGDASLRYESTEFQRYDLGEAWKNWCGLPFVYALWITRKGIDPQLLYKPFLKAKQRGMENINTIARETAIQNQKSTEFYLRYFQESIRYDMNESELQGMKLFFEKAKRYL